MIWGSTNKPPQSAWPPTETVMASVPAETRNYINRVIGYMTTLVNDPVYLASGGGGELPPDTEWPTDSEIKMIAGLVVGGLLLFALMRR